MKLSKQVAFTSLSVNDPCEHGSVRVMKLIFHLYSRLSFWLTAVFSVASTRMFSIARFKFFADPLERRPVYANDFLKFAKPPCHGSRWVCGSGSIMLYNNK